MHQGSHAFVVLCFMDRGATSDGVDVIFVFFAEVDSTTTLHAFL
jgi:hypothetical protein